MINIVQHAVPGVGTLYCPPGDEKRPVIVVLHGSEGGWSGWSHRNALLFAAHGFNALAFAYSKSGNHWNAGSIENVPLDRTAQAIATLRTHELCNGWVGLYGLSRGGEHALLLTSLAVRDEECDAIPDAVAVFTPSDVICGAFDAKRWRDQGDPGWQVWDPKARAWTWKGSSEELLPSQAIEIERYDGPLLISHGTADKVWNVEMTRRLERRLRNAGRTPEVHFYEGEGHSLTASAENEHLRHLMTFFHKHAASSNAAG